MKQLLNQSVQDLIVGSTFFGTGGGGPPQEAERLNSLLLSQSKNLDLYTLDEFKKPGVFITCFGVGSVEALARPDEAVHAACTLLSKQIGKEVIGVIPVEIGAESIALTFYAASLLGVPVLDADIVGGRSTPEVFLETITLFDIPRTPAAVANDRGEFAILERSSGPKDEEQFFRSFAEKSGGLAYVVGYPMTYEQVQKALEKNTVSDALRAGSLLRGNQLGQLFSEFKGKKLFEGHITAIEEQYQKGFTTRMVSFEGMVGAARLFIKNENLILWINDKVVLTCPDLIIMVTPTGMPIYNADLKIAMDVTVVGFPARPLWRGAGGKKLFNPRLFGFDVESVLL